ncbi:MAG TPA: preprotein translocase subunit YajC [Actinomycetota bacterium]|nr:preprotein translocase subunit YajC [Actinomycetota bacterium]
MTIFAMLAQEGQPAGGTIGLLLPLLLMAGIFYFMLIRPQQRRARQQRELIESLRVGDEVMTAGGMFGTVRHIDPDSDIVTLEISPGTKVRMVRGAIARRLTERDGDEGAGREP